MARHKWDWQPAPPARRRRRASYEDLAAPTPRGWADPRATKAITTYNRTVWGIVKALVAIPLTLVLMLAIATMVMIFAG